MKYLLLILLLISCNKDAFKTKVFLRATPVMYLGQTNIDFQLSTDPLFTDFYTPIEDVSVIVQLDATQKLFKLPKNEATIRLNTGLVSNTVKIIEATTIDPNIEIIY